MKEWGLDRVAAGRRSYGRLSVKGPLLELVEKRQNLLMQKGENGESQPYPSSCLERGGKGGATRKSLLR